MDRTFPETLASLRRERGVSQRRAAADLNISQALLSHYENGAREPGLGFVCKVCEYYSVSADYLLCRSDLPDESAAIASAALAFLDDMRAGQEKARSALMEFMPGRAKK